MKKKKLPSITGSLSLKIPVPVLRLTGFVGWPHEILLDTAKSLISQEHYMSAVVIAQTACEILTELTIKTILVAKRLDYLDHPISGLLPNYNLGNEKVRKLYVALSGDKIQDTPFWVGYTKMVTLRNKVVHKGTRPSLQQAEQAYKAAKELIKHLEQFLRAQFPNTQWMWKEH